MLIQLTNHKAARLIRELEKLHLIKVIKETISSANPKLSINIKVFLPKNKGKI